MGTPDKSAYRERFASAVDAGIRGLAPGKIAELDDRLRRMIDYAIGRVDYYEAYRTTYQRLGMAFVAAGVASAGVLFVNFAKAPAPAALVFVASALLMLAGGVHILLIYNSQTSTDYPHRRVADIKSWYFKYNISQSGLVRPHPTEKEMEGLVGSYSEQLEGYIGSWIEHASDPKRLLLEDIEQVYTLFAIQAYKRAFVEKMSGRLSLYIWSVTVLVAFGLLLLAGHKILGPGLYGAFHCLLRSL